MQSSLSDIVRLLFKRRRIIALAFVLILIPAALAAISRPLVYRARARLMVTQSRAYLQLSPETEQHRPVPLNDLRLIAATAETLRARSFLSEVGDVLAKGGAVENGDAPPSDGDGLDPGRWWAARLAKGLEIIPHANAPLIEVAYRASDADSSARVVNAVIDHYIDYEARAMFDNPTLRAFYEAREGALRTDLAAAERELTAFQNEHGIYSVDTQRAQLTRIHGDAVEALRQNAAHIGQAEAEAQALMVQLQRLPAQVTLQTYGESPRLGALNSRVVQLELGLDDLRALYTDEDRRVQDAMKQLALAQDLLMLEQASAEQTPTSMRLESNDAYQNILENALRQEAAGDALRARREEIQRAVDEAAEGLREFNRLSYSHERLRAAYDAKQASYKNFLTLLEQARSSEAMDREGLTNVRIADSAAVPRNPEPSHRWLTLAMGMIASLTVGIAGAFGLEALSDTVHSQRDGSERLALPVFAVIPEER
jgi:uncharacterized protein involved in exopolysaccharide biosynthesis